MKRFLLAFLLITACSSGSNPVPAPVPPIADTTVAPVDTVVIKPDSDVIFIGAGNVAGAGHVSDKTADLIANFPNAFVFALGNNQEPTGSAIAPFALYDATWGKFKDKTIVIPGDAEYVSALDSANYYKYFGVPAYYATQIGSWRVYALNSSIDISAMSPQVKWLQQDIVAHDTLCTIAMWFRPLYTSDGVYPAAYDIEPLFKVLYDWGVDVALTARSHNYERFDPQTWRGFLDTAGVQEFVVGTGGAPPEDFSVTTRNSAFRYKGNGVLKLTLHPTSYDWQFLTTTGAVVDSSVTSRECY